MVFGTNSETFVGRVDAGTFGYGPAQKHAI